MKIEQEQLGISYDLPEFLQRDIEAFYAMLRKLNGDGKRSNIEYNGNVVRTAAKLGWLDGVEEKDVGGMRPNVVNWLASELSTAVSAAFDIPGE